MTTTTASIDRTPTPCENCGEETSSHFLKECIACGIEMRVCDKCIQDDITVEHEECPEPELEDQ